MNNNNLNLNFFFFVFLLLVCSHHMQQNSITHGKPTKKFTNFSELRMKTLRVCACLCMVLRWQFISSFSAKRLCGINFLSKIYKKTLALVHSHSFGLWMELMRFFFFSLTHMKNHFFSRNISRTGAKPHSKRKIRNHYNEKNKWSRTWKRKWTRSLQIFHLTDTHRVSEDIINGKSFFAFNINAKKTFTLRCIQSSGFGITNNHSMLWQI